MKKLFTSSLILMGLVAGHSMIANGASLTALDHTASLATNRPSVGSSATLSEINPPCPDPNNPNPPIAS